MPCRAVPPPLVALSLLSAAGVEAAPGRDPEMLKVTMPSPSSSSSSSSSSGSSAAGRPESAAPDYWIDGSNKDTLAHYFELESELGR